MHNIREAEEGKGMRQFNFTAIKEQKWDSEMLSLIAAIYSFSTFWEHSWLRIRILRIGLPL